MWIYMKEMRLIYLWFLYFMDVFECWVLIMMDLNYEIWICGLLYLNSGLMLFYLYFIRYYIYNIFLLGINIFRKCVRIYIDDRVLV